VTEQAVAAVCTAFAAQEDRRCRFVHVPWPPIYWLLRSGEFPFLAFTVSGSAVPSGAP
jgi:hypothetical protein